MNKYLISIAIILLFATSSFAAPKIRGTSEALYPPGTVVFTLFNNQSTVGPGTSVDTLFLPNEATWEVVPFGAMTSQAFEVTLDASIRCVADSFYPVSTMNETTQIRFRGINFTGYRCVQPNFRSKTGQGGITVYTIPRGN